MEPWAVRRSNGFPVLRAQQLGTSGLLPTAKRPSSSLQNSAARTPKPPSWTFFTSNRGRSASDVVFHTAWNGMNVTRFWSSFFFVVYHRSRWSYPLWRRSTKMSSLLASMGPHQCRVTALWETEPPRLSSFERRICTSLTFTLSTLWVRKRPCFCVVLSRNISFFLVLEMRSRDGNAIGMWCENKSKFHPNCPMWWNFDLFFASHFVFFHIFARLAVKY